jgi:hypothetical protein
MKRRDLLKNTALLASLSVHPHSRNGDAQYLEPRYDHPEFQNAFNELNHLLAARFDRDPLMARLLASSDSIIVEEPVQIEELATRSPCLAAILEDGALRKYDVSEIQVDAAGVNMMEGTFDLIVGIANRGVAGVPGVL